MASIKKSLILLSIIILSLGCQKQKSYPTPGFGINLVFSGLECESIQVHSGEKYEGYMLYLAVKGNKIEADPIIEQQVRAYYSKSPQAEMYQGGSVLQNVIYCDKVCEGISITASADVLGRTAGEDFSDAFFIYYSDNPFLFDKDKNLIGVLELLKATSIQDYLSLKALMLPDMELYLNTSGASLAGIDFTVNVSLEGGKTMTTTCTVP